MTSCSGGRGQGIYKDGVRAPLAAMGKLVLQSNLNRSGFTDCIEEG